MPEQKKRGRKPFLHLLTDAERKARRLAQTVEQNRRRRDSRRLKVGHRHDAFRMQSKELSALECTLMRSTIETAIANKPASQSTNNLARIIRPCRWCHRQTVEAASDEETKVEDSEIHRGWAIERPLSNMAEARTVLCWVQAGQGRWNSGQAIADAATYGRGAFAVRP